MPSPEAENQCQGNWVLPFLRRRCRSGSGQTWTTDPRGLDHRDPVRMRHNEPGPPVMREYAVDPLVATFVREVMEADVNMIGPQRSVPDLYSTLTDGSTGRRQLLYPVTDTTGRLLGIVPWSNVLAGRSHPRRTVGDAMVRPVSLRARQEFLEK